MEDLFFNFREGFAAFEDYIIKLYIVVFMLVAWLFNQYLLINKGWQKLISSLVIGLLIAFVFAWGFNYSSKKDIMSLLFSLIFSMVLYKAGIDKMFFFLSKKSSYYKIFKLFTNGNNNI